MMAVVMMAGCRRASEGHVTVFVSGDTAGWITPCGCTANQSGGLARRSTLVHEGDPNVSTLVLDAGGSAGGTSQYHLVRLESILRGMNAMDLFAHNIGRAESELGSETLHTLAGSTGVPWLSSNLTSTEGNWNPPRSLVKRFGDLQIAVVGVIDPDLVSHPGWRVQEPVAAIVDALRSIRADIVIVLAYMDQAELQSLASALPEVHAVVGGPTGQAMSPIRVGSTTVISATNKGKFLATLSFDSKDDRDRTHRFEVTAAKVIDVASTLPEDPIQLDNLADYYERLSKIDFPANETGLVSTLSGDRDGYGVAGSVRCQSCHALDDKVWHSSKHSHAWDALVAKTSHYDPTCQQCHTTGYGLNGGFMRVAESADRVHVGCENCHGPSQVHVDNPRQRTPWVAKEQCVRCHDRENSPTFDPASYWGKITHGPTTDLSKSNESLIPATAKEL